MMFHLGLQPRFETAKRRLFGIWARARVALVAIAVGLSIAFAYEPINMYVHPVTHFRVGTTFDLISV